MSDGKVLQDPSTLAVAAKAACLGAAIAWGTGALVMTAFGVHPFDAMFEIVFLTGPAVLGSATIAGALAFVGLRARWTRASWLTVGSAAGAITGCLAAGAWAQYTSGAGSAVPALAGGGMVGAIAGTALGLYCSKAVRWTPRPLKGREIRPSVP